FDVVPGHLEHPQPVATQRGPFVGVVGDAVAVAAWDGVGSMVLVSVEVDGDLDTLAVEADEMNVRAGAVDGVLQPHPPARAGLAGADRREAQLANPRWAADGFAREGEAGARRPSAFLQGSQKARLQLALDLVDERDLVHALVRRG